MNQDLVPKILAVQKQALADPEYLALLEEHDGLSAQLPEVLPALSPDQRDAVPDYFGLCHAMHLRLPEPLRIKHRGLAKPPNTPAKRKKLPARRLAVF